MRRTAATWIAWFSAAALTAVAGLAPASGADGPPELRLVAGEAGTGEIAFDGEEDRVAVDLVAGMKLTAAMKPSKKSLLSCGADILDSAESVLAIDPKLRKESKGTVTFSSIPVAETGTYYVAVRGTVAGPLGAYDLATKAKAAPKPPKAAGTVPAAGAIELTVDALSGSQLAVVVTSKKGSSLRPRIESVTGPGDVAADLAAATVKRKETATSVSLSKIALPAFGTWRIRVVGDGGTGGDFTAALTVTPPKPSKTKRAFAGASGGELTAGDPAAIEILPAGPVTVSTGATARLQAKGTYANGRIRDLTRTVAWSTANRGAATMSSTTAGQLTGVAAGGTKVLAWLGGTESPGALVLVGGATVQTLEVVPAAARVALGESVRLAAVATIAGTTPGLDRVDVTRLATWAKSGTALSSVDGGVATAGAGAAAGTSPVTASLQGVDSTAAPVENVGRRVEALYVTPSYAELTPGQPSRTFSATAVYSDGTTAVVTAQCSWTTDNLAAATLTNSVATRVANGTAGIRATLDGVTSRPAITNVGPVALSAVVLSGGSGVARGGTLDLSATGTFADGGSRDITAAVTWASGTTASATVSDAAPTKGRVSGVAGAGASTVVTASVTVGGAPRSGTLTVACADPAVALLRVVPAATSVGTGETKRFAAIATLTDGSSADVSGVASWATTSAATAGVDAGNVTGVANGGAVVTATHGGKTARAVAFVGTAQISTLRIESAAPAAAAGESGTWTTIADFGAAGGPLDITGLESPFCSDPLGVVYASARTAARRPSSPSLSATFAGLLTTPQVFDSGAAVVRGITTFPQAGLVSLSGDQQLAAQVRRSDGSVADEAPTATWTSASPQFVTVSATGLAHAVVKGSSVVTSSKHGFMSNATITVAGDVPVLTSVSPATVLRGQTGVTLTLNGTGLDGLNPSVSISGTGVTLTGGPVVANATRATITVDVAAGAATGFRTITYTTLVGTSVLTNAVQVVLPAPTIASISPAYVDVPLSGSTVATLTVTGTGFATGDTFSLTTHAGVSLGTVTVANSTTMTAQVTIQSTAVKTRLDVTVNQSAANGGATATLTQAFKVGPPDPTVTSVSPAFLVPENRSRTATVTVTGANFLSGINATFQNVPSNVTLTSVTRVSSTQITCTVTTGSSSSFGAIDLALQNPGDATNTFQDVLAICPRDATITSFSAASFARGVSNVDVTIRGTGFRSGDTPSASGSDVTFSNVTVVSAETITARVTVGASAALGARSLLVTRSASDGGRSATLASAFTVVTNSPTVTSVNPSKVGRSGSGGRTLRVPVVVTGTNFSAGATVTLTKTSGSGLTVVSGSAATLSSTQVSFALDVAGTATTGLWDVKVTNPSGGGDTGTTGASKLEIVSETTLVVHRVAPASGSAFGGERVTVEGAGFARGCRVEFGGEKAANVQFVDANSVVATVPPPANPSSSSATTLSTTAATQVDVRVTNDPSGTPASATLTGGWSYAADGTSFEIADSRPLDQSTGIPLNQKSFALRLTTPANTNTAVAGTTRGTHCYWFQSGSSFVSGTSVGFGADPRWLVFTRSGGGNLTASAAYVAEIPTALKARSGRALTPSNLSATYTYDQWGFTVAASGTDTTAPTVSSTSPASNATGVGTAAVATVTFSEDVDPLTVTTSSMQLKQGSTVLNAVVTVSDDLRTVTIAPTEELARNTTYTISVGSTVADLCGNAAGSSTRTFTTASSDTTAPVVDDVVLAGLPASVDGSGTYVNSGGTGGNSYDVYLPTHGWTVTVRFSDAGDGVDATTFSAKANCAVGASSANAELAGKFTVTGTGATWTVGSSDAFAAQDDATLTFTVRDTAGNLSSSKVVTFDTVGIDTTATGGAFTSGGDHDPFDTRETWVLRFDLDVYTMSYSTSGTAPNGTQQCTTTASANGIPDVEEALLLCGLQTTNTTANPNAATVVNGSSTGTNAIVLRLFQERVQASLRARFGVGEDGSRGADAANVEFLLPGERGSLSATPTWSSSPSSGSSNAYNEMDIGGDTGPNTSQTGYYGTVGIAYFDLRNRAREANLNSGASAGNNNGIFAINMYKALANVSRTGTTWGQAVLARFVTTKGGTPVGESSDDDEVLAGTFDRTSASNTTAQNDRYDQIMDAIELAAMSASGVTAHEIGHSVGLVPDAAPKTGFFGYAHYSNTFTEATAGNPNTTHHLDFLGNDVMPAASSVDDRTATGTDFMIFNPMDGNYLRHRQVHDEGK